MTRGLRASHAVLASIRSNVARVLDGYEHIQQYDPRDKNPSTEHVSETSGSGLAAAAVGAGAGAAPNQDIEPSGSGFAAYFLSGIAVMMALIAVSYGMLVLMTKLGWIGRESEEDANGDAADADAEPSWKRMTIEERRRVLDTALEAKPHGSFRVALKANDADGKKMKITDEESSSSDDSGDDDSCVECVESASSITSVSGRYKSCTSRRRDNDQDRDLDKTSHIHSDQNETSESHVACSICLEEYQAEDEVILGLNCIHMFHKDCAIDWLEKQEVCPCCREKMICDERMAVAAQTILGPERMQTLEESGEGGARTNVDEFEAEQRIVIPAW